MTDIEMIMMKKGEPNSTLIAICNNIANSVTRNEYDYWVARREQFFTEGKEAVEGTIRDDIEEGFYPPENNEWK
jgi:hypothetical protein